jgi:hypothetical protein
LQTRRGPEPSTGRVPNVYRVRPLWADLASLDLPRVMPTTCGRGETAGQRVAQAVLCKQGVGGSSPLVSTGWSSRRKRPPRPSCRSLRERHPITDLDRFGTIHPGGLGRTIWAEALPPVEAASSVVCLDYPERHCSEASVSEFAEHPSQQSTTDTCPRWPPDTRRASRSQQPSPR